MSSLTSSFILVLMVVCCSKRFIHLFNKLNYYIALDRQVLSNECKASCSGKQWGPLIWFE